MKLYEELYFEINVEGQKSELKKFVRFLKSGELEDFFEITNDYFCYDDEYQGKGDDEETSFVFTNDDLGIEIDEFNPEEFLEMFCKGGKNLSLSGHFYDIDDEEYDFTSAVGDDSFEHGSNGKKFNDELDEAADAEEEEER